MQGKLSYRGKIICGPMVRVSTLGFRLLCAKNGADIVYSEEIIANKLCKCVREVKRLDAEKNRIYLSHLNEVGKEVDLIEFVHYDFRQKSDGVRTVVFSTLSIGEGAQVIVQLGAADAEIALQAAKVVQADVHGIDLNMGCPKGFSTDQGMGAALLSRPELAVSILSNLVKGLSIPVSVKIRCMGSINETVRLIRCLDHSGVHSIVLHAREKEHRYTTPALHSEFRRIRDIIGDELRASFILNGDIFSCESPTQLMEQTRCDGLMICRAAMHNPSVFKRSKRNSAQIRQGVISTPIFPYPGIDVREFLESLREIIIWHMEFEASFAQIKYHVLRILQEYPAVSQQHTACVHSKNLDTLLLGVQE